MSNQPFAATISVADSWAEVRAHDQVMRYRRQGVGRAVLVLHSLDDAEPLWPELVEALGAGFRLIVPEPPAADVDVADWLANFLEGLGVPNVRILAVDGFCIPALEVASLQSGQIARIVLVPDAEGLDGALEMAAEDANLPLLVVRRGQPAREILPLVTRFLEGDRVAPP